MNSDLEDEVSDINSSINHNKLSFNAKEGKFIKAARRGVYSKKRDKIHMELNSHRTHLPAWCFNETFRAKYGLAEGGNNDQV